MSEKEESKLYSSYFLVALGLLGLAFRIQLVSAAEHHKFKTCEQTSYCQRHRNHKSFDQDWTLDLESLQVNGYDVNGRLYDSKNPSHQLKVILSLTEQGAIRMKIDELEPVRRRFEAKETLNPNLRFKPLTFIEKRKDLCIFEFGPSSQAPTTKQKYQLILFSHPFQAQVINAQRETVVLVNSKGLMRYEIHQGLADTNTTLFGAPKEARAFDEAGRALDEPNAGEQIPDAEATSTTPEPDTKTYVETFSTFTDLRPYGPMSVGVDIYFPNSEHIYGVPEHTDGFNLKDTRPNLGDPYRLYNVDIFEYEINSKMALYGAIPFIISQSKKVGSFGVFWLNPSETWIDIESNHSNRAGVVGMLSSLVSSEKMTGRLSHWFSETGLIDIWFMPGPEPPTVVSYNAEVFGTVPLPPLYSIGFHQCRWNYYSDEEVMQVQDGYDRSNIPLDAIWLDVEYTEGRSKKYFTWDKAAFPDPVGLALNLSSKGRRLIAIIDPHIKKESNYHIYEEGNALDNWVKDVTGQNPYEGWCWPGASMWPDYLSSRVRQWWAEKFRLDYFPGQKNALVDIWNDMNEPSVFSGPEVSAPRDLRHVDGWEHRDIHNIYGLLMTMATYEGMAKYRRENNLDRPFILTRSFFAGSQRYASAWTGDNKADWEHLKVTVPMLLSMSISGMPFVGADVSGFFSNPESEELFVRWHQAAAFQPFFRAHAHHDSRKREAYLFKPEVQQLVRNAIQMRYSYSPYWYTLFFESHVNGWPMMRPLWFHEPNDETTYNIEDTYLLGYSILVKPVLEKGVTSTSVYLPGSPQQTAWFDLNSHIMYSGGSTIQVPVDISTIPIFHRAGTIVPRSFRVRRSLSLLMRDPFTLDIVLGENQGKSHAQGHIFVDDYTSLEPNASTATLTEVTYHDEILRFKPSTDAKLNHGIIERIVIYNWPVNKKIQLIVSRNEGTSEADQDVKTLSYNLEAAREDGTASLWIKQPQKNSILWRSWTMKIHAPFKMMN